MNHIVGLSGGKDSTAMALRLAEVEPRDYTYICTPTGHELPEMEAHWEKLERILGKPLVRITNHTLEWWIREFKALPNWRQRWCTRLLKIEPTIAYIQSHQPAILYVGLRADEEFREGIYSEEVQCDFPLRRFGWGIKQVWEYLRSVDMSIPDRTDCGECFFQRIDEWRSFYFNHKPLYERAAEYEDLTRHTFRGPNRDSYPAGLRELAAVFDEQGMQLPLMEDEELLTQCRVCSL